MSKAIEIELKKKENQVDLWGVFIFDVQLIGSEHIITRIYIYFFNIRFITDKKPLIDEVLTL